MGSVLALRRTGPYIAGDRFVIGLVDVGVKQKLHLMPELTLDKATAAARQYEQVKEQLKTQEKMHHSTMSVYALHSYLVQGH